LLNISLLQRESLLIHIQSHNSDRFILKEPEYSVGCRFLSENNKCTIYPVRPTHCRTYPWWGSVISNPTRWDEEKKHCEGIDHIDAPLTSQEKILDELKINEEVDKNITKLNRNAMKKLLKDDTMEFHKQIKPTPPRIPGKPRLLKRSDSNF